MPKRNNSAAAPSGRLGRLRLRQLELLIVIARHMSLTTAADASGVNQSTLSKVLGEIEDALGAPLFIRGRPLRPTAALATTLQYARRAVADAGRLADDIRMLGEGAGGRLRIGTMMVATAYVLPRAIAAIRASGSALDLEIYEDIAVGLWPRLERAEIDLLIGRTDPRALVSRVQAEKLFDDPHVVVVGPNHPLAKDRSADLTAASRFTWSLPPRRTPLREVVDQSFIEAGLPLPREAWYESGSITLNLASVTTSDTVFVTSSEAARFYAAAGLLAILPIRFERDQGPVIMAWHQDRIGEPLKMVQAALRRAAEERRTTLEPLRIASC